MCLGRQRASAAERLGHIPQGEDRTWQAPRRSQRAAPLLAAFPINCLTKGQGKITTHTHTHTHTSFTVLSNDRSFVPSGLALAAPAPVVVTALPCAAPQATRGWSGETILLLLIQHQSGPFSISPSRCPCLGSTSWLDPSELNLLPLQPGVLADTETEERPQSTWET